MGDSEGNENRWKTRLTGNESGNKSNWMATKFHEIRDPVHGLVKLSKKEIAVINTGTFQRLRRIRQLAMAFLVYPGALHTRFDHSIGVMHIAGQICNRLKQLEPKLITDGDVERIRLASLLHDIGHGPFSHVSEYLLDRYGRSESMDGKSAREKIHEKVTVDIIKNDPEIGEILSDEVREFIVKMIQGKETRDFRRDIVSSDLDADKMDYLLRDSYFAGVQYGNYDLEKIIESFRVQKSKNESYLAMSDEGIYALEQLLLAKRHMTQQVYRHRVRSISDAMIVRGIQLAIRDGNEELKRLYQYEEKSKFIKNYVQSHDERLIDILKDCDQKKAKEIFKRLYERKLFKMISEIPLKDIDDAVAKRRLLQMDNEQKLQWERKIAEHISIEVDYVIVEKLQIQNPNYGSRSYNLNPESIMIFDEKQEVLKSFSTYANKLILARPPSDESDLEIVQVYAPMKSWDALSKEQRGQKQSEVRKILLQF